MNVGSHRQSVAASFFRQQGYLALPGLIPHNEVQRVRQTVIEITSAGRDAAGGGVTAEVVRIDRVTYRGEPFDHLVRSGTLLDAIQPLIGPNIEFIENRHNHVSLYRTSKRGRAHRDILQWSRSMVTVLVYLSDCSCPEGATRVVPGSHLWPCCGRPNNGGTWLDELPELASLEQQALLVPAAPGDVLCMDGLLYHSAGGACSAGAGPRIVVTLAFRSVDELAPADRFHRHSVLVRGDRIYRGNPASDLQSSPPRGRCIGQRLGGGEPLCSMLDIWGYRLIVGTGGSIDGVAEAVGRLWATPSDHELLLRNGDLQFAWWRDYRLRSHAGLSPIASFSYDDAIHLNRRASFGIAELQVMTYDLYRRAYCDSSRDESHERYAAERARLFGQH